jgi:hypothetical protein
MESRTLEKISRIAMIVALWDHANFPNGYDKDVACITHEDIFGEVEIEPIYIRKRHFLWAEELVKLIISTSRDFIAENLSANDKWTEDYVKLMKVIDKLTRQKSKMLGSNAHLISRYGKHHDLMAQGYIPEVILKRNYKADPRHLEKLIEAARGCGDILVYDMKDQRHRARVKVKSDFKGVLIKRK